MHYMLHVSQHPAANLYSNPKEHIYNNHIFDFVSDAAPLNSVLGSSRLNVELLWFGWWFLFPKTNCSVEIDE